MTFKEWLMAEMPVTRLDLKGQWQPGAPGRGYNRQDIGILTNPRGVEKIKQAWSNTKQDYEIYFLRDIGAWKHQEVGEVTPEWVKENLNVDILPKEDAITIIFTNNRGGEKVPMTAWIIAHRLGHAISRDGQFNEYFRKEIEKDFKELLREIYGFDTTKTWDYNYAEEEKRLRALAYAVGTMKSTRNRSLVRFGEFIFELVAQYLITGKITFNPIPRNMVMKNRMAWGRPAPEMRYSRVDQDALEEWNEILRGYAEKYEHYLDSVLSGCVGNIYVM